MTKDDTEKKTHKNNPSQPNVIYQTRDQVIKPE